MAKKSAGKLAGLAALGAAAYMMNEKFGKGKDAKGPSATADEEKSSKARTAAQREAVSGNRATDESSYTGTTKNNSNAAKNIGFGGGDDSDKNLRRVEPAPVDKREVKSEVLPQADEPAKEVKYGDPSQSKGVLRSDKDMTQAEAKTILNQTPADKAAQAAKDKKAIASNKANSRAYQRNLDAAKGVNLKSNAEFNRKQQAKKAAEAHAAKMKRLKDNPELQAAEPVYPEQLLTPGGGYKTAASLAKNLANRTIAKQAGKGEDVLSAAGQRLKNMEEVRNVAMPGRNATVTNPNAWAAGPKGMDKIAQAEARAAAAEARAAAAEAKRNSKDPFMSFKPGSDFKRGGMTKMASGGMTASRRGDGIASRGKTKCKMY